MAIKAYVVCVGQEIKVCWLIQRPENLYQAFENKKSFRRDFVERISNSLDDNGQKD